MGQDEVPKMEDPEEILMKEAPVEGLNIITTGGVEFDSDDDTRTLGSDSFAAIVTDDEESGTEQASAPPPPMMNVFQYQPPPLPCPVWDEISPLPAHAISEVIPEESTIRIIVKPCNCFDCFNHMMSVFQFVFSSVMQQQEQETPVPPPNDQN